MDENERLDKQAEQMANAFNKLLADIAQKEYADADAKERAKTAQKKKAAAKYVPSWEEAWVTGWNVDGKHKNGIFQMSLTDPDRARLYSVKEALENGALSRLPDKAGKVISKSEALALFPQLQETRKASILAEMVEKCPANYRLIQTVEQLEQLAKDLLSEPETALDTETNGLNIHGTKEDPTGSEIVGLSITLPRADYHVYIPVAHKVDGPQLDRAYVFERLRFYLEGKGFRKVLHNAKFDAHMFRKHGIRLRGIYHDTMIVQRILNENEESYALKNLSNKYGKLFGYEADSYTYEELFGKNTPFDAVTDLTVALVYAAKDTELTWLFYKWQRDNLKRLPRLEWLYDTIENPIIDVCLTMERTGFLIDLKHAGEFGSFLKLEIHKLDRELRAVFGVDEEFNFDSPAQLAALLFDRLGLPDMSKGKRSTDAKALKALKPQHVGAGILLEYREKTKLYGTYVEALPSQICADGMLRGQFNQVRAVTGRFSSDSPNLQNLPPEGKRLIIAPAGSVILGSDFSQIEPRLLADISGDEKLRQIYRDGKDLYAQLASDVFGLPIEQCVDGAKPDGWKKEPRKMMKVGLLAVMYGISMYALAESLGMKDAAEAQQFIDDFYAAYPQVYEWMQSVHRQVYENEYVETMYGRKRRFPGHKERVLIMGKLGAEIARKLGTDEVPRELWALYREWKDTDTPPRVPYKQIREYMDVRNVVERDRRMAVNAIIQGSAADVMKIALIKLADYCESKGDGWAINGTVHDEALSLVPESITLQEVLEMESLMTGCVEGLSIPLKVDTEIFKRWGDGISKKEWFKNAA